MTCRMNWLKDWERGETGETAEAAALCPNPFSEINCSLNVSPLIYTESASPPSISPLSHNVTWVQKAEVPASFHFGETASLSGVWHVVWHECVLILLCVSYIYTQVMKKPGLEETDIIRHRYGQKMWGKREATCCKSLPGWGLSYFGWVGR